MRKYAIAILTLALLGGCSRTFNVMEVGPYTYSVSSMVAQLPGVTGEPASNALEQANTHCTSLGKYIDVLETQEYLTSYGTHEADVVFRCIDRRL